jgi:protocatechuate 3,4-dioxygenase beta subunit
MQSRRDLLATAIVAVFVAVVFPAASPTFAAPAPQAATVPAPRPVTIKVSDDSGKPVEGVTLWLLDSFRPAYIVGDTPEAQHVLAVAVTDKDGIGQMNFTPKGYNQLIVFADNFAPQHIPSPPLSPDKPFEFRITRGQTISGSVHLENGRPLGGASIRATRKKSEPDFFSQFYPTATTDKDGRFQLTHVAPGLYELVTSINQPVFVQPTSVDASVSGQPKPLDLVAYPGVVLKGKFVRSDKSPPGSLPVDLFIRTPKLFTQQTFSAIDGSFTVYNIPPDSRGNLSFYKIEDSAQLEWPDKPQGCEPGLETVQFQNLAAGTYDGIIVKLYKPAVFQGTILDETGKPYERAVVMVMPLGRGRSTDAQGHFSVNLPPGLDSTVRISNADIQDAPTPLNFHPAEGELIEKNLTLRRKTVFSGVEMRGRVIDAQGKPVIGAIVQLGNSGVLPSDMVIGGGRSGVPRPTWSDGQVSPAQTLTDGQGNFRFDKLMSGKSDVWADVEQMQWGLVHDVDTKSDNVEIVLRDGPARAQFQGVVEDSAGHPVSDAQLFLYNGDWFRSERIATTKSDGNGRFSLQSDLPIDRFRHVRLFCQLPSGSIQWKTLPKIGDSAIPLRFGQEAAVSGRLVNNRGEPLAGAKVWLGNAKSADAGYMTFVYGTEVLAPQTTTDADGRFRLDHLPTGAEISLTAKHPDYLSVGTPRIPNIQPDTKIPNLHANDGVSIEGVVRLPDGKPAAGAVVKVTSFSRPDISTQTDDHGAYKLTGVPPGNFKSDTRIVAKLGNGPQWEGSPSKDEILNPGDHATGWDITLDKSLAVKLSEWQANPVPPPASKYTVAVLDDADPATEGTKTFHDTLTVYDGSAKPVWQYNQLNIRYGGVLAADPTDRSVYVYETGANRLDKFTLAGALAWSQPRERVNGIVVDPDTRNVLVAGSKTDLLDPSGKQVPNQLIPYPSIALDAHSPSVWAITTSGGHRPVRMTSEGKILSQSAFTIDFGSQISDMSVNPADGSFWLGLRGMVPIDAGHNRIVAIAEDGQLLKQMSFPDDWPRSIAVDTAHNALWIAGAFTLHKLSPDGVKLTTLPITGQLCLEPDTGCLWVASPNMIYRISPDARFIASSPSSPSPDKRICLVGR